MLQPNQLEELDRLKLFAEEKKQDLRKTTAEAGLFHNYDYQLLANVPGWVDFAKENHANVHAKGPVAGCLRNLREVAKRFGFKKQE